MRIPIRLLDDYPADVPGVLPTPAYATEGAAGVDLYAAHDVEWTHETATYMVQTGVAVAIPPGYCGLVFARSSLFKRTGAMLGNAVGVIDSDYRGPIMLSFRWDFVQAHDQRVIERGQRVAQMVIVPCPPIEFEVADSLNETVRGAGGYGSTDAPKTLP